MTVRLAKTAIRWRRSSAKRSTSPPPCAASSNGFIAAADTLLGEERVLRNAGGAVEDRNAPIRRSSTFSPRISKGFLPQHCGGAAPARAPASESLPSTVASRRISGISAGFRTLDSEIGLPRSHDFSHPKP